MININKTVYNILSGITSLSGNTSMQPIILDEKTDLPALIFQRSSTYEYTMDGYAMETTDLIITILSEKYDDSITISTAVFDKMQTYKDSNIKYIRLMAIDESYAHPAYIQKMSFEIKSIS